jgi:hypothetical protein
MFRSFFTTIFRGSSAVLCAVTISPADLGSFGFVLLHSMWPHVYVICVCLVFLSVGDLPVHLYNKCTRCEIRHISCSRGYVFPFSIDFIFHQKTISGNFPFYSAGSGTGNFVEVKEMYCVNICSIYIYVYIHIYICIYIYIWGTQ